MEHWNYLLHLLQVEEISLAVTTLRGADMVRQYYPNTKMVGAAIINLSRSDNKFDNFTVCLELAHLL